MCVVSALGRNSILKYGVYNLHKCIIIIQFFPDCNAHKSPTITINVYNIKVLQNVLEIEVDAQKPATNKDEWRDLPLRDMDLIIVTSYGDEWDPSIEVVPKQQNSAITSNSTAVLARKEMEAVIDQCREDKGTYLRDVCSGSQLSKHGLLERIEISFNKCDNEGGKSV